MDKNDFNEQALRYIQQIIESGKGLTTHRDSVAVLGANMEKLIQLCKEHPLVSLNGEDDSLSRKIHETVRPCLSVEDSGDHDLIMARKNRMFEELKAIGEQYAKKETEEVEDEVKMDKKPSYDFKEIDTKFPDGLHIGKKGEKFRLKAMRIAYDLGFSKNDCRLIGEEIGRAYTYNRITGKEQDVKDLLYHSRTFRASANGVAYLKENGFHVDSNSLSYQDALQDKRELLDIDAVTTNWVTKPKGSALSAITTDLWGWIIEPTDRAEGYRASRVAQRLGYSPEEVERIGREVTDMSDRKSLFETTVLRRIFGGSAPTTDQLLFQSATFQSHPELAKPYIGLKHIESKESQFEGYVLDGERLREKVGDEKKVLPTVKGYMGFDDPMKEQAAYEMQSSAKNRIGSFLSSGVGFVLLSLLLFFLFKSFNFHPVGSAIYALGGSTAVNFLGRLMTNGVSQQVQSAGNIEDMMREVGIAGSPSEEQTEGYELQNMRDIPIGKEKEAELSESDYLRFVQEHGLRGLRQQLINEPWKFQEFLSGYGLLEAERQESEIFRRNGDWLSYTQRALSDKFSAMNLNERVELQQFKVKN